MTSLLVAASFSKKGHLNLPSISFIKLFCFEVFFSLLAVLGHDLTSLARRMLGRKLKDHSFRALINCSLTDKKIRLW